MIRVLCESYRNPCSLRRAVEGESKAVRAVEAGAGFDTTRHKTASHSTAAPRLNLPLAGLTVVLASSAYSGGCECALSCFNRHVYFRQTPGFPEREQQGAQPRICSSPSREGRVEILNQGNFYNCLEKQSESSCYSLFPPESGNEKDQ